MIRYHNDIVFLGMYIRIYPMAQSQRVYRDSDINFSSIGLRTLLKLRKISLGEAAAPLREHLHSKYKLEIIAVVRGIKNYRIDDRITALRNGEACVVFPGQRHASATERDEKGVHFCMTLYLRRFAVVCGKDVAWVLRKVLSKKVTGIIDGRPLTGAFGRIYESMASSLSPRNKRIVVINALRDIVVLLAEPKPVKSSSGHATMSAVLAYIRSAVGKKVTIKDLCNISGASPQSLHRWFMREHGVPPKEFILREKIEAAKRMLARPSMSVRSCAYKFGFVSEQYFSVVFKRFVGIPPGRYAATPER